MQISPISIQVKSHTLVSAVPSVLTSYGVWSNAVERE